MNKLPMAKRVAVVSALVEGNSIRSTVRMTDVSKPTILKLLADVGRACAKFQGETIHGVRARRVQVDEIWQFVYAKRKNVTEEIAAKHHGAGDVWTWVALDSDTKMILTWRVGPRDLETAYSLMKDLAARTTHRMQLTTDGYRPYLQAVEGAFDLNIDYAMLHKVYGQDSEAERRYSPATVLSTTTAVITGDPNPKHISTSHVERQNLTMRMSIRRFTRLTNAFSKKLENHAASVALHFMHYNFARVHQTLRVTPAMQAGIANHVWSIEEIVSLSERAESATAA